MVFDFALRVSAVVALRSSVEISWGTEYNLRVSSERNRLRLTETPVSGTWLGTIRDIRSTDSTSSLECYYTTLLQGS